MAGPVSFHARAAAALPLLLALACASPPAQPAPAERSRHAAGQASASLPGQAVRTALSMIGAPYRFGGASPRGFDCSGLVVYSYGRAGLGGLPHSAAALERHSRPVPLSALRPGDLIFFDLHGRKASHVGIYLGGGEFVHAPSAGKRVERVGFDHVYWGRRIERAGRLTH